MKTFHPAERAHCPARYSAGLLLCLLTAVTLFPLTSEAAPAASRDGWKISTQQEGVEVWTRPAHASGFDDFIGIAVIEAPIDIVEKVLENVPASTLWVPDCAEARVIRKVGEGAQEILMITRSPWPLSDREALMVSRKKKNPWTQAVSIDFHAVHDPLVPVRKGNVRIPALRGRWVLVPVAKGRTRVAYSLAGDPGGYIPSSVAAMISRKIPLNTLLGLRSMVRAYMPGQATLNDSPARRHHGGHMAQKERKTSVER